jgi:hypothetical protein
MVNAVSSALAGNFAAPRRFDAAASNLVDRDARRADAPAPGVSAGAPAPSRAAAGGPPPNEPPPVEETNATSRGPAAASLHPTAPSYLSALDPSANTSDGGSDAVAAEAAVAAAAQESEASTEAAETRTRARASERSEADQRAIRANSELVRRLYDLG